MSYTNITKQLPLSDTRHLSELKFEERSAMPDTIQAAENPSQTNAEPLATDMVMLQKADVWMSQFKTRLNFGIIALVLLWGTVSWYKGTREMHLEAKSAPEAENFLADGTQEQNDMSMPAGEADHMNHAVPVKAVDEGAPAPVAQKPVLAPAPVKTVKPKAVKKAVAKVNKGKPFGGKAQSKNPKKKSLAAKPAA